MAILKAFEIYNRVRFSSIGVKHCLVSSISFNFIVYQNSPSSSRWFAKGKPRSFSAMGSSDVGQPLIA